MHEGRQDVRATVSEVRGRAEAAGTHAHGRRRCRRAHGGSGAAHSLTGGMR